MYVHHINNDSMQDLFLHHYRYQKSDLSIFQTILTSHSLTRSFFDDESLYFSTAPYHELSFFDVCERLSNIYNADKSVGSFEIIRVSHVSGSHTWWDWYDIVRNGLNDISGKSAHWGEGGIHICVNDTIIQRDGFLRLLQHSILNTYSWMEHKSSSERYYDEMEFYDNIDESESDMIVGYPIAPSSKEIGIVVIGDVDGSHLSLIQTTDDVLVPIPLPIRPPYINKYAIRRCQEKYWRVQRCSDNYLCFGRTETSWVCDIIQQYIHVPHISSIVAEYCGGTLNLDGFFHNASLVSKKIVAYKCIDCVLEYCDEYICPNPLVLFDAFIKHVL